jgi:hypothetical protein
MTKQFVVNGYQETSFQLILIVKQALDIAEELNFHQ